jgi:hypothetical protein
VYWIRNDFKILLLAIMCYVLSQFVSTRSGAELERQKTIESLRAREPESLRKKLGSFTETDLANGAG